MSKDLIPWEGPRPAELPSTATTPSEFVSYAIAIPDPEQARILAAFGNGLHHMATEFVWVRSMVRLKAALGSLGMDFVGEMLDRDDVDEFSDPDTVLTDWNAIKLAENLGIVSSTGALKLRHAAELLAHLNRAPEEDLNLTEATTIVRNCVQYVLAEQDFGVAVDFSNIRDRLVGETIAIDDEEYEALLKAPPFFLRTALRVLLATIKQSKGAKLQHSLSNLITFLPESWNRIGEDARWLVGEAYAEMANANKASAVSGLRQALVSVSGFDYVPENLRSETFKKAAQAVLDAHHGMNNYATEAKHVRQLAGLGTVIPNPAFLICVRAYLCVYLGNYWGHSWTAAPVAEAELRRISEAKWIYYLDKGIISDAEVLRKLLEVKPLARFAELLQSLDVEPDKTTSPIAYELVSAASKPDAIERFAKRHLQKFRGK